MKRACSLLLLVLPCALPSVAQSDVDLRQLFAANTLDQEGKPPFHVKLEFQLYDLEGKPSEKGTVEEWWASPKLQRIVITAPSFTGVLTDDATALSDQQLREQELIKELLAAELHPMPLYQSFAGLTAHDTKPKDAKAPLRCISVGSTDPKASPSDLSTYCADPPTNALRLRTDACGDAVSRNTVGTFHDTKVALDVQIAYEGKLAITGHMVTMSSFDPATSKVDLSEPDSNRVTQDQIAGTITAGGIIKHVDPVYPSIAKAGHIAGGVILHAVISKQGTISQLAAIASPSRVLTDAAVPAVSQWIYTPFLRDGNPVEVDTIISVNFMFSSSVSVIE